MLSVRPACHPGRGRYPVDRQFPQYSNRLGVVRTIDDPTDFGRDKRARDPDTGLGPYLDRRNVRNNHGTPGSERLDTGSAEIRRVGRGPDDVSVAIQLGESPAVG